MRVWVQIAWCALTLGIGLGSWWAYYELGWGGWWFWDPVENASLMPWLAATALLHSVIVVEQREQLKSWTVLLAIIGFSLSSSWHFYCSLWTFNISPQLCVRPNKRVIHFRNSHFSLSDHR